MPDHSPVTTTPAWRELGDAPAEPALLAPDELPRQADVVVVGLGASGLEAISLLAQRGAAVVGVDAVGVAAGAAGANGGFLLSGLADFHHDAVARHGRARTMAWTHRTLDELDRLYDSEPTARRVGSLRIAADRSEEADCRTHLDAMRSDGLDAQAYDGPEGVGVLVPTDGVFQPVARCRRLAHEAIVAGATLVAPVPVASVTSGRVTVVGGRSIHAPAVLVAVDGGLEHLVPSLRRRVNTARLQMLATAPDGGVDLPRPIYRRRGYDYAQQRPSGEVLVGGGRDVEGDAAWGPAATSAVVQDHLDAWAAELGVTAPVTHRWAARAAFTTDRLPVDDEVEPGVRVVGGYSGHGNVIGGMIARRAATRIVA